MDTLTSGHNDDLAPNSRERNSVEMFRPGLLKLLKLKNMLTIKVEPSPGSDISEAFTDAIWMANKLHCFVHFKFNDVVCLATPNGNVLKGVEGYNEALKPEYQHKIATS